MSQITTIIEQDGARHWDSHPDYLTLAKWAIEHCNDRERCELFDILLTHDLRVLLGPPMAATDRPRLITPAEQEIDEAERVQAARFFGKELAGTVWETSDGAPVG